MTVEVRPGRPEDGEALRAIERAAGERFRTVGLGWVADDEPTSVAALAAYAADGRSWVAVDAAGTPVGYLIAEVVDGCAHVEQVSVAPSAQGTGVGRALLDAVGGWAAAAGRPAVTLTTFADVPWNRPLYEHLGFRVVAEEEIGPGLAAVRAAEAAHGLDPATRACMRLDLA
ncbi:MAG TPA: GNAT family N-acetyltransferase [Acidimicrobiales bacterium]|nr:GNAT family N-acetyltransferase [Acidimicrobiales bacterium]